ncbi:uncharacterized protein RCO7_14210 [Rhynchosporium graminicola]|uniref:Uncharacterized protein n=1 Tax=Rhynchosporium graminicola TaxID=2792576 RepID=A0A1E1K0B8_9HELO|nr:uncharacterized protein RCO7_14210 [Rhynchosporium commune]
MSWHTTHRECSRPDTTLGPDRILAAYKPAVSIPKSRTTPLKYPDAAQRQISLESYRSPEGY